MNGTVSQVGGPVTDAMRMTTDAVVPVSSRELFWRARYLRASGSLAHLPFLFWLFADHKPRRTVTLNMNDGVIYFAACQAVDKLNFDALCFGFGEWNGTGVPETIRVYNSEQYEEFSQLEEKSPDLAAKRQPNASLDLLIAENPRMSLIKSIATDWEPKFSDRAVVMLTDCDTLDDDALSALDTLEKAKPCLRLDHGGGLRVFMWGDRAPDRLLRLAQAEVSHPAILTLNRVLSRLGALHVNEWTARDKSAWARRLTLSLNESEEKTANLIADSQSMQAKLEAATEQMSKAVDSERRASEELKQSHATISAAKEDITRLRQWITSLNTDLSNLREATQKDATLQAKVEADLRTDAKNLQTKLDIAAAETRDAKRALTDLREQTLQQQNREDAEKNELRAKISKLEAKLKATHAEMEHKVNAAGLQTADLNNSNEKIQTELSDAKNSLTQAEASLAAQSKELELTRVSKEEATSRAAALQSAIQAAYRKGRALSAAMRSIDKKRRTTISKLQKDVSKFKNKAILTQKALDQERQHRRTLEAVKANIDEARVFHILASQKIKDLAVTETNRLSSELVSALDDLKSSKAARQTTEETYLHKNRLLSESLAQANETIQSLKAKNETQFTQLLDQLAVTEERSIQRSEDLKRVTRTLEKMRCDLDPTSAQAEILKLETTVIKLQEKISSQDKGFKKANIVDQNLLLAAHENEIARLSEALADAKLNEAQHSDSGSMTGTIKNQTLTRHRYEIEELTAELRESETRLAALAEHNRKLEETRDALLSSTSWRLTAPIRQLTTAMRRG